MTYRAKESVLPAHSSDLELALEQASRWVIENSPIINVWDVSTVPDEFLPWLAQAVSVDEWDSNWPDEIKRRVILQSHTIHRHRGTRGAVRRILETLGLNLELREWFELDDAGQPYGPPHTFAVLAPTAQVLAAGYQTDGKLAATINRLINHVKPARAHFHMRYVTNAQTTLQIATTATARARHTARLTPRIPPVQAASALQIATTTRARTRHRAVIRPAMLMDLRQTTTLQVATTATTRARHAATVAPTATIQTAQTTYTYPLGRTAIRVRARSSHTLETAA